MVPKDTVVHGEEQARVPNGGGGSDILTQIPEMGEVLWEGSGRFCQAGAKGERGEERKNMDT